MTYPARWKPAPYAGDGPLHVDTADEIRHVIALVTIVAPDSSPSTDLLVGVDDAQVIHAVPAREAQGLSARARAQLESNRQHKGMILRVTTRALYLLDTQVVEHAPDEPGANDPLYLYGVLRGPYPTALTAGVRGVEGQLATTRGAALHGFQLGLPFAFRYAPTDYGTRCAALVVPGGDDAIVLAFALPPPLGRLDDVANDLVAAQLVHDVMGAVRRDLGDDLAKEPVPVPHRPTYEAELRRGGWAIEGNVAKKKARGGIASLFSPAQTQVLPPEASLQDYAALVPRVLLRVPGLPDADARDMAARVAPPMRPPTGPMAAVPAVPPPPPRVPGVAMPGRPRSPTEQGIAAPGTPPRTRPPSRPPPIPARPRPPTQPPPLPRPTGPGGGPADASEFLAWIQDAMTSHTPPGKPAPRAATPQRAVDPSRALDWMFDVFDPDEKK